MFSPLWDAPYYSSLFITAPLITRHNQTPSMYSLMLQCACIQSPNWEYLHLRSLCHGQGYIGRPLGTSKSPEFGEAGTRAFVSNHQCLLFEEWANALRDPGANKYTAASAGHKHWQSPSPSTQEAALRTGGVEDSWKHTCHATSTFTATYTEVSNSGYPKW